MLGKGSCHGIDADRTAVIMMGDAAEITPVHAVQAEAIHIKIGEGRIGGLCVDNLDTANRREVPNPAKQPRCHPGGPS